MNILGGIRVPPLKVAISMSSYFIYYTEANIVCVCIFAIILVRDLLSMDRQEKQIKYDHALIAFMLYFVCDACWAAIIAGVLPRNLFTVLATNFGNYILMAAITYAWLRYVMAVENIPGRDSRRTQFGILFPFYVVTIALIVTYLVKPTLLLDENFELQPAYDVFQITVPCIYIAAVVMYTVRKAISEESPLERRKHLYVGLFPLMVVGGGLLQVLALNKETPVFCFACAILMIIFYINALEAKISTDPLTGLNNRGQLLNYTTQKSNLQREGRQTVVVMFDINDFKSINDTYGHAEGDRALKFVADSMRAACRTCNMPLFLARYGGDEFIIIAHPTDTGDIAPMIENIREQLRSKCRAVGAPYVLEIGAGHSQLEGGSDTFQLCLQRADENLYLDKTLQKSRRPAAAHR